jgi:prevent-host-death family protein
MKTISQRELRNESAAVMRKVQQGESFRVTSRGAPVAVLSPVSEESEDTLTLREGTGIMEFPPGVRIAEDSGTVLDELRGAR